MTHRSTTELPVTMRLGPLARVFTASRPVQQAANRMPPPLPRLVPSDIVRQGTLASFDTIQQCTVAMVDMLPRVRQQVLPPTAAWFVTAQSMRVQCDIVLAVTVFIAMVQEVLQVSLASIAPQSLQLVPAWFHLVPRWYPAHMSMLTGLWPPHRQ